MFRKPKPRNWHPAVKRPRPAGRPVGSENSAELLALFQHGYSGPEVLAWAVITRAVEDVQELRAAGVFSPTGAIREWPRRNYRHHQNGKIYYSRKTIVGMTRGCHAEELKEWFQGPGAQAWIDAVNSPYSAQELWRRALAGKRIIVKGAA